MSEQAQAPLLASDTPHSDQEVYSFPGGVFIQFQRGALENGRNGITSGELLGQVLIPHLKKYQAGKFACRENAIAITHLETALLWLEHRARTRAQQGVLGRDAVHQEKP